MDESGSISTNTSSAAQKAEPIVKGELTSRGKRETERSTSEPSSIGIAPPGNRDDDKARKKNLPQRPPKDVDGFKTFRTLCDDIFNELKRIDAFFVGDDVSDNGSEVVAEIEVLIEDLYGCEFGQGESLKRVVVAIQSQVNNVRWKRNHVEFLRDVIRYLRVRYVVDEAVVNTCYDFMKTRGLDRFRGTICEPSVVKRYRVEEVLEDDSSSQTAS